MAAQQAALAGLSNEYRKVLGLRFQQGLSLDEVAARMNRSQEAVRSLLYRAQKKLKEAMGRSSLWLSKH